MDDIGFVKIRRGLFEHIRSGRMKSDMLSIYTYLHLTADIYTGMVMGTSAPYIGMDLRKPLKHVQRQLIKLEKGKYIKRFGHRGCIQSYNILINKYETANGILIDTDNSKNINEIAYRPKLNRNLIGTYVSFNCPLGVFYVSSVIELKNIQTKKIEKDIPVIEKKQRKHSFEKSPYFDYEKFKLKLCDWSDVKIKKYYDAAKYYSVANGGRYLDWIAAVKNWERKEKKESGVHLSNGNTKEEYGF